MVEGLMPFNVYVSSESSLSPRHREILILRIGLDLRESDVWSSHAALAKTLGLTDGEIRRIAEGAEARGWEPFEATLLRMTDQLYRNSSIADSTWDALKARYDMYHLMDAVMTVTDFTTLSIMYNAMGVQPDEGVVERLPTDIPYRVAVPEPEPPLKAARVDPLDGSGLAITRTFARYPKLAEPRSRNSNYVNQRSKLMPRYREMLILTDRLELPVRIRMGAARGQRGTRPRLRAGSRTASPKVPMPQAGSIRGSAAAGRRRAVSGRDAVGSHLEHPRRALDHHDDDERGGDREQLPDGVDGAERAGRPARSGG